MKSRGFTIVELLIVIVVIGILAGIVTASYGAWQRRVAQDSVKSDVGLAAGSLKTYQNFKNSYPPNLAGTGFAGSSEVALKLSTNATQVPQYQNLTPAQNAQLFLNACNANMPITSGSTTYNTSCSFSGNNIHVKGQSSSNVVFDGPTVTEAEVALTCGSPCNTAVANIKAEFIAQGGTWPLTIPSQQVALPEPTLVSSGPASKYCLEGISTKYPDIVYYVKSPSDQIIQGACPNDPDLHYP